MEIKRRPDDVVILPDVDSILRHVSTNLLQKNRQWQNAKKLATSNPGANAGIPPINSRNAPYTAING